MLVSRATFVFLERVREDTSYSTLTTANTRNLYTSYIINYFQEPPPFPSPPLKSNHNPYPTMIISLHHHVNNHAGSDALQIHPGQCPDDLRFDPLGTLWARGPGGS